MSETFKQRYPRLDVLINNAGVLMPARAVTEDGYETTFQVNYLSQFHLTHLLLDELKKSREGRIINLSSSVYRVGKFDEHNLQSERRFSTLGSYSASKLLVLLFTIELANRLKGTRVTANAVHPGIVRTQMMLHASGAFKAMSLLALPFSLSPQPAATTSVYLAASPQVQDVSGKYFTRGKMRDVTAKSNTQDKSEFVVGPQHEGHNSRGSEVAEHERLVISDGIRRGRGCRDQLTSHRNATDIKGENCAR